MRRLIAGIDYGTSNSAAAYTIVHDDDKRANVGDGVDVIKDWPRAGASADSSDKVLSEIAYAADGKAVGHGFGAAQYAEALQWVKLLLEPESFKEQSNRTSQAWSSYYALGTSGAPRNPVDVVADYLRWLWGRTKAAIVEREDEAEDTELFDAGHLTVVLTVPASWSAPAKRRMARAAVQAGIPERCLKTLAEPEAAAVYGLEKKASKRQVDDGDCVIICDAGGGTVDTVAYKVITREPLALEQITVSKGDFCGSSFVNKEFRSQLQLTLGDLFDDLSGETKARIDEEFEYKIKRAYNPLEEQGGGTSYHIPVDGLADDESLGIKNGRMRLDNAIIYAAFDSVMTPIMALIDHQVAQVRALPGEHNLKGLLLVGGFGKSGFLRNRIKQEFSSKTDPKIWAADDSWTAVVKGAVACEASAVGRQALIRSRLSSYNYGIRYREHGILKVHWLVRKGQAVQSDMPTQPYALRMDHQPWLDEDETCLIYLPIVTSADDAAGDAYTDAVTSHAEIKCRVPTALRFAPESREIQVLPAPAWHIPATLALYFDGALIGFRCHVQGREVGVAQVRYFAEEDGATAVDPTSPKQKPVEKLHRRADSHFSILTGRSSGSSGAGSSIAPSTAGRSSIDRETVAARTNSSTPSTTPSEKEKQKDKKQKKRWDRMHYLTAMTTEREEERHRRPKFLAPSPLMDLPPEERLNGVYGKGWARRKDSKG